jgi:DNA-directed RNA polymerase subunit RPC12/RpoP
MKFVCKDCNYRFESKTEQDKRNCPYCGKKAVISEPSADELLGEID